MKPRRRGMPCGTRTGGRMGLLEHYVVDVGWAAVVLAGARACRDRAGVRLSVVVRMLGGIRRADGAR